MGFTLILEPLGSFYTDLILILITRNFKTKTCYPGVNYGYKLRMTQNGTRNIQNFWAGPNVEKRGSDFWIASLHSEFCFYVGRSLAFVKETRAPVLTMMNMPLPTIGTRF